MGKLFCSLDSLYRCLGASHFFSEDWPFSFLSREETGENSTYRFRQNRNFRFFFQSVSNSKLSDPFANLPTDLP